MGFALRQGATAQMAAHRASQTSVCSALLTTPIAHRGLHSDTIPENSLTAFRWAVNCKLPIELDVQLLADGQVAVFHDFDLARMTGVQRSVADVTTKEAANLRLLQTDEKLPLFEAVLDLVRGRVPLLVELKSRQFRDGELEKSVVEMLAQYKGDYYIQSFHYKSLLWLRKNAPHVSRGQLSSGQTGVPYYKLTKPYFVAYALNSLPNRITTRLRESGVPLLVWTISTRNEQIQAGELADNYIFNQSKDIMDSLGLSGVEHGAL
jgi:glycerophosphoryl diester phosphodiesterase